MWDCQSFCIYILCYVFSFVWVYIKELGASASYIHIYIFNLDNLWQNDLIYQESRCHAVLDHISHFSLSQTMPLFSCKQKESNTPKLWSCLSFKGCLCRNILPLGCSAIWLACHKHFRSL